MKQPKRVRILKRVISEILTRPSLWANPGEEYECDVNPHGAVSIRFLDGNLLGVKPDEFEVIEWTE